MKEIAPARRHRHAGYATLPHMRSSSCHGLLLRNVCVAVVV